MRLTRWTIFESRTSWRIFGWSGIWSATAAPTQTSTAPTAAPASAPPTESSIFSGGMTNIALRADEPIIDPTPLRSEAPMIAPTNAATGVYGESEPLWRTCGARRAPITAPATTPPSDSAVAMNPRRSPPNAHTAMTATAIQSTVVTPGR